MIQAKDLKNFIKNIPDNAAVIFNNGNVIFLFNDNTLALNQWGATWENGIGYPPGGTSCCGECTCFECDKCKVLGTGELD